MEKIPSMILGLSSFSSILHIMTSSGLVWFGFGVFFSLCQLLFFSSRRELLVGSADRCGHLCTIVWLVNAVCSGCCCWGSAGMWRKLRFGKLEGKERSCCCYPVWIVVILESCVKTHRQIRERCLCNGELMAAVVSTALDTESVQSNSWGHTRWFIAWKKLQRSDLCLLVPKSTTWCKCFLKFHSSNCWLYQSLCVFY